jgi:3-dehydroquinate synthase II
MRVKLFWVDVRPWNKDIATTALEQGAGALMVDDPAAARALGRVTTISPGGDLEPGRDIFEVVIDGKAGEEEALVRSRQGYAVVSTTDWSVIPLENLVSQSDRIVAVVRNAEEACVALTVLEKGCAGILLRTDDPAVVKSVAAAAEAATPPCDLVPLTVTRVEQGVMGDRVCVDTCSLLHDGEGMLVGSSSSAFLLVHAETLENPYVAPRPFRVNAGTVHAYVMMADGKTKYLSEVRAGDRVLVTAADGSTREAMVGRVKVERRPLVLFELEAPDGTAVSAILQNAETVRLVGPDGAALSVASIRPGDVILGHLERGGRHFGVAVEETIMEQ